MNEMAFGQSADSFLDILVVAAGLYLVYAGIIMKLKGEIPKSILSKNIDLDNAPDKAAYIRNMFIPCICMGALLIIGGGVFTAFAFFNITLSSNVIMGFYIGSMAVVIAFGVYMMNMQNRYLKS